MRRIRAVAVGVAAITATSMSLASSAAAASPAASKPVVVHRPPPEKRASIPAGRVADGPSGTAAEVTVDAPAGRAEAGAPAPSPLLGRGSTGPAVRTWQDEMNGLFSVQEPIHPAVAEDGIFGPLTLEGTESFQRYAGIAVDGVVGPVTRGAASRLLARSATPTATPAGSAPATVQIAGGDEIVTGRGDNTGYHLYAASSEAGWRWQPLAVLSPAGGDVNGERWIGRQCLTGDGRYVVAVVAPWHANNDPAGMNGGGLAYVVDAHTGAGRPLIGGVSLYYFDPSCGPGSTVALTRYVGVDQHATELVAADAASASAHLVRTVPGEVTAAVPSPGGVLAVRGDTLVDITGAGEAVRSRLPGQPFDLVANAEGGADFLVGRAGTATVWQLAAAGARQVGTGPFAALELFPGRQGHTVAVGVDQLDPAAGLRPAAGVDGVAAVSATGAEVSPHMAGAAQSDQQTLALRPAGGGAVTAQSQPVTAAPVTTTLPPILGDDGTSAPFSAAPRPTASPAGNFVSTCAVARNRVDLQVMQPSPR